MVMPFFFKLLFLVVFFIAQFSLSCAYLTSRLLHKSNRYLTTEEHWFNQTVDHFSAYDHRKFQQRYYEFSDYFRSPDGPIFLQICGESACRGIVNDYLSVLAKKFGATIVSPEHRYYGKSSPFKSHTTENLKYLSSKQALFDLAAFRQYYQESLNQKLKRSNGDNPWFVFGGSYSGALSAWFRLKFPHLTCGSLASSAVVLAVQDFTEFDQQIGVSAGPECKAALQEVTQLVEGRLKTNNKALKSFFDADELTIDGDFLYFLADAAVIAFQYGNPDKLCPPLVEAKKAGQDLLNAAPLPPSGALGKQAVALRISADKAAFIGCKFIGSQDTLYDHTGRHYFKDCYIAGSVDFVFGNGLSLYDGCHLHAVTNTYGALTAQKRGSFLEETGFSFVNCRITGSGVLYLGRAWGTFSRVVFAYTYMEKIITPSGWYDWGDKSRDMTVFYGQFKCSGPGADYGKRVSWSRELTQQEAQPFISLDFIDGYNWLKSLIH